MSENISRALIQKYLDGTCTQQEIILLHEWYNSFESAPDPLTELSDRQRSELKRRMLSRIRLNTSGEEKKSYPLKSKVRMLMYGLSGAAAIFIFIFLFAFLKNKKLSPSVSVDVSEEVSINNLSKSIYKASLSDGSVVWLGPNSSLRYPRNFHGKFREVSMKGEAFFEVAKDHSHPFIIYSGEIITKVWGTSFRVRDCQDIQAEVSVVTGKVSVSIPKLNHSEVMLYPDQKVTYLKAENRLKKEREKKISSMKIWKKTSLSFDNVPLSDVIATLNSEFATHISTNDASLRKYVLKADFNDQSLPYILEMLEKSLNVSYEINGKDIVLSRKIN